MLVVGLTGGIGSGKTTAAARFAEHGAAVIDADAVAREIVAPGEPALEEIRARFGEGVVTASGELDRAALADRVFADPADRRDLEAITHGRINEVIADRLDRLAGGEEPVVVILDHPLLIERGGTDDLDAVVVVTAPGPVRRRRLVAQRGMRPEDVDARIAQQATDERRRAEATHVLDNSGSREELYEQVDRLWPRLARRAEEEAV